jgi:hypothetical protein
VRAVRQLVSWRFRQWAIAALGGFAVFLALGLPTDVIDNPVFGRAIDETPWAMPVLVVTAVLSGLLVGSYVRPQSLDGPAKSATLGGALTFFAIGCPVCNKLVLVAVGTTGAVNFFEPIQPFLAGLAIVTLLWALYKRLSSAEACDIGSIRVDSLN